MYRLSLLIFHFLITCRSFYVITFSASGLGYAASLAPDAKKASRAAEAILEILHRQPQLQPDDGNFPDRQITGEIVFHNLHFRYPTRKNVPVLKVSVIIYSTHAQFFEAIFMTFPRILVDYFNCVLVINRQ